MEALRRIALGAPWTLTLVGTGRPDTKPVAAPATTFVDVPATGPSWAGTPMTIRGRHVRDFMPATAV